MKVIISYGTYDLFHYGHVQILKRMKHMGDKLVIGCSTDSFNSSKGKKSFFSYKERYEILSSCKYVDHVFPEVSWDQKVDDINKYKADIFVIGDDWTGKFDFIETETNCSVVYLPRTLGISTTNIKNALAVISQEKKDIINQQLIKLQADINSL